MNDKSYKNWKSMTDRSLIEKIGQFVQYHRLQQNKTQAEVADMAGMSRSTLSLLERGETVNLATLIQVLRVLNLLHVMEVFEIPDQISPLALAKLEQEKRQRARKSHK